MRDKYPYYGEVELAKILYGIDISYRELRQRIEEHKALEDALSTGLGSDYPIPTKEHLKKLHEWGEECKQSN